MKSYRDMYDMIVPREMKNEVRISLIKKGWTPGISLRRKSCAYFHKRNLWLLVIFN